MHRLSPYYSHYVAACRRGTRLMVQLGAPGGGGRCAGQGICRTYFADELPTAPPCPLVVAYLRIDQPTGRLLIHFELDSFGPDAYRHHLAGGFRAVRPYRLPARLVSALGLPAGTYSIEAGTYPTLPDNVFATLSLRIRKCIAPATAQKTYLHAA